MNRGPVLVSGYTSSPHALSIVLKHLQQGNRFCVHDLHVEHADVPSISTVPHQQNKHETRRQHKASITGGQLDQRAKNSTKNSDDTNRKDQTEYLVTNLSLCDGPSRLMT